MGLDGIIDRGRDYKPYILVVQRTYQGVDVPDPNKPTIYREQDIQRAIIGHDEMIKRLKSEFIDEEFRVFAAEPSQLETGPIMTGSHLTD